jgi:hypothetical protein
VQLAVMLALGLCVTCGGGVGDSPAPPPPPSNAIQLTLQPAQLFQTWEAWRGTLGGPNFIDNTGVDRDAPPQVISNVLDALADDLGINGVRYLLHNNQNIEAVNDDPDPNHINWSGFNFAQTYTFAPGGRLIDPVKIMTQMIQPLRQRVLNRGEPFSLYVSPSYQKADFPAHWLNDPNEYAEMVQAAILWMQKQSPSPPGFTAIVPDYWVIANEPDGGSFGATQIGGYIAAVGQRFASMGVSTKIQASETTGPNITYLNTMLNMAGVIPNVGLVSFHGYDYSSIPASFTSRNETRTKAQILGIRTAMTEICCRSNWDGVSYTMGLGWARDIYWNATEADISVWEPLALLGQCQTVGCTAGGITHPFSLDKSLSNVYKFPPFYALRQYSHFIRPGYRRVGMTCSNCTTADATLGQNVKPVAFKSPAGKVVVVVINDQSFSQSIALLSLPAGTYDITGVDPTTGQSTATYPTQTIGAGQALTVTFPSQAILTFAQR